MTRLMVENLLGYSVTYGGVARCVISIWERIARGDDHCWLACINPHSYVIAQQQPNFAAALHAANWLVPDGAGIVLASRILGGEIRERVTGSDIFQGVMQQLDCNGGYSVFFLGSSEENLLIIGEKVAQDYPAVQVAGTYSPPFKAEYTAQELDAMVDAINKAAPDVLWVGMTAPKQELWIRDSLERLETVKFAAAIGAVFDFYSGKVKRSHPFFQHLGLEWLPRLIQQPRRLWQRMFVSAPIFVWHVLRARFGIVSN